MAASGIAEHNEARRKERRMQRNAFQQREMRSKLQETYGDNPDLMGMTNNPIIDPNQGSYEQEVSQIRKVGSPPGIPGNFRHDPAYVDKQRRELVRQQQLVEYSAKMPNRFSSINYIAQW